MNRYLKLQNGSDIRGVAIEGVVNENVNLTKKEAFNIAISFSRWLSVKLDKPVNELRISVGSDSRLSANSLRGAILSALNYLEIHSLDCGIASTPSMFMSTIYDETKCDGAIMITASHLPYNRNGFKFFTRDGGLDKEDITSILTNISEDIAFDLNPLASEKNNLIDLYSNMIVNIIRKKVNSANFNEPLKGMNIIVDAGNGSGGFFAEKVLEVLGANTKGSQFLDPDGTFPNHIPNPEDKVAMQSITDATIKNKADLGIIFDTDVDRAAVVDKFGKQVNRNRLIALMSVIALKESPNSIIVTDSVTSTGLSDFISNLGGVHHRFKRGYKNVINESIRLNKDNKLSHLAIETSGHGAFKENYFLDDGAYIVTKILIEVAKINLE
ncbi:MAG: phosphomannomutase/phosphoglucomutase [Acidaminobacteraceae bacterium]